MKKVLADVASAEVYADEQLFHFSLDSVIHAALLALAVM